jgi:hypothetical protein
MAAPGPRSTRRHEDPHRTSPAGRTATSTIDARGRVVAQQSAGLLPETFAYDGRVGVSPTGPRDPDRARGTTTYAYNRRDFSRR